MQIDIKAVRDVFRDVLAGRMTREAADRWANALVQQSEAGALSFVPESEKKRIWDGIMYLYGVDLMPASTTAADAGHASRHRWSRCR